MMRTDVKSLIAALPQEEAERARARLDRLEQTCACGLAVAGAFAALLLYVSGLALWLDLTANNAWMVSVTGFAVSVLGAGLGKTFGLMRARSQRGRFLMFALTWFLVQVFFPSDPRDPSPRPAV
jgi:hypothetical protein